MTAAGCGQYDSVWEYLADFSGQTFLDGIKCAYAADWGLGMGPLFMLFVFSFLGMALSVRTRHPGPVVIAGLLSAGVIAAAIPGVGVRIMAIVLFVAISAAALYIYQRAQSSL